MSKRITVGSMDAILAYVKGSMSELRMSGILIAYDSTEGQTRKIARYMGDTVSLSHHEVHVIDIRRPPSGFSLDGFDAIVVGASIRMSKHSRQISEFVRLHKARLEAVPSTFFSVSLSAAGSDKEKSDATRFVEEFLQQTGWTPTMKTTFGGGLLYREYGFLKRWMMKKIARDGGKETDTSKNHEYTDWNAVNQFMSGFLAHCEQHYTRLKGHRPHGSP